MLKTQSCDHHTNQNFKTELIKIHAHTYPVLWMKLVTSTTSIVLFQFFLEIASNIFQNIAATTYFVNTGWIMHSNLQDQNEWLQWWSQYFKGKEFLLHMKIITLWFVYNLNSHKQISFHIFCGLCIAQIQPWHPEGDSWFVKSNIKHILYACKYSTHWHLFVVLNNIYHFNCNTKHPNPMKT